MNTPLLLDLFSGAGGSARGYADAGFEVIGVDIAPQPHYPYRFIQADALDVLNMLLGKDRLWHGYALDDFAAMHASVPCQEYSKSRFIRNATAPHIQPAPKLIPVVRERLEATGLPWIIENVVGAPLPDALQLCGSMFGLPIRRHRWFACSHYLYAPGPCQHTPHIICCVGNKVRGYGTLRTQHLYSRSDGSKARRESYLTLAQGQQAMGIDWMTIAELSQAIPPAYTKWIGKQLIEVVRAEVIA